MSVAYLLVAHGSRDPRPHQAMQNLASVLRDRLRLTRPSKPSQSNAQALLSNWSLPAVVDPLVGMATLELACEPLSEQIRAFSDRAAASRYSAVRVVPLFLLPGVHVMQDIPQEVEQARATSRVPIELCPYLGSHKGIAHVLADAASTQNSKRLLLAHGSSYPDAHQRIETIARQLGWEAAYWAIAPNLESKITELASRGCHTVDILPYFLFRGSLTDAIAQQVNTLRHRFPTMTLHLAHPLGAQSAMADLVLDLMTQP